MPYPIESIQPAASAQVTATDPAAAQCPRGRPKATAALLTAGLLLLLVGVLVYLVVLSQPFADASGGCGGG